MSQPKLEKMIQGIKSLATPLEDLILREAIDDEDYAEKAAEELTALRSRIAELEAAGTVLCKELRIPVYGMDIRRSWECYSAGHEMMEKLLETKG